MGVVINSKGVISDKKLSAYWGEQIRLKRESGLSRAAYCRRHGIVCSQFAYWEQRLNDVGVASKAELLPVKLDNGVADVNLPEVAVCTLVLKNGAELKIHDSSVLSLLLPLVV